MNSLTFRFFQKEDFKIYKAWFKNHFIKKAIGDIDEEWLHYILNDKTGIEYAVFKENELVAVIGVSFPTKKNSYYGIHNIAINPKYFRKGIGSMVLKQLYQLHPLKQKEAWLAFVHQDNLAAKLFFERNNWSFIQVEDENLMRYEYAIFI